MPNPARRSDFDHDLRTGRRTRHGALEYKFNHNHNHDPANGRFASGGGGATSQGHGPLPGVSGDGPFAHLAARKDDLGKIARDVDAFALGKSDSMAIPLGGTDGTITITRLGGADVKIDHYAFSTQGTARVLPGHRSIQIDLIQPHVPLSSVVSFPSQLTVYQSPEKQVSYEFNRDLLVRLPFRIKIHRPKGSFVLFSKDR